MLDRVLNISPEYRDRRASVYQERTRKNSGRSASRIDSISFSPAAVFLGSMDWLPKELKYSDEDKLFLHFFIQEFEIKLELDIQNLYSNNRQVMTVLKYYPAGNKKIGLLISLKKKNVKTLDGVVKRKFPGLKKLMDSAYDLELQDDFSRKDSLAIQLIVGENEEELFNEFDFIMTTIYTLIEKMGKTSVIRNFQFKEDSLPRIMIEKIAVVNV